MVIKRVGTVLNNFARMTRAIRASQGKPVAVKDYQAALRAIQKMSEEEDIPIVLVGGAATIHHGYERSTSDIDIVVSVKDFEKIIKVCYQYGIGIKSFNPTGFHELFYKNVPIEVIQEGAFGHSNEDPMSIPSPGAMGVKSGLGVASLATWVQMKLSGGRRQDLADIVEVLKHQPATAIREVERYLGEFNNSYLHRFLSLLAEAEEK